MSFLIILRSDEGLFDEGEFRKFLETCPGVSKIRGESIDALFTGRFDHGEDSTFVSFTPNREVIAISDSGPAAYEFSIRFQKASKVRLRLVDESLCADLQLTDYQNADDLRDAIVKSVRSAMKNGAQGD